MALNSTAEEERSSNNQITYYDTSEPSGTEENQINEEDKSVQNSYSPVESSRSPPREESSSESSQKTSSPKPCFILQSSSSNLDKSRAEALRLALLLTMTNFVDWNLNYLIRMRGILNLIHIILSLVVIITLTIACQWRPRTGYERGYFCESRETFLFFVTWFCCLTATLFLLNCSLSKTTDLLLFNSDFELIYYGACCGLLIYSTVGIMVDAIKSRSERIANGTDYGVLPTKSPNQIIAGSDHSLSVTASIVGFVNSGMYFISVIWFFVTHYFNLKILLAEEELE